MTLRSTNSTTAYLCVIFESFTLGPSHAEQPATSSRYGDFVEWLVAVSIKSAGQWLQGWAQTAALSTFAGAALALSQFRRAVETKKCSESRIERHVAVAMSVAD